MLLCRALESAVCPGAVRVEGEHFLQVLKHVIKHSTTSSKGALLKLPPLPVHVLLLGLEVAVKVSLLVGLMMGVKVVLMPLMLTEVVKVFEKVIKVEGLEVLFKVIVSTASSASVALPW